MLDWTAKDTFFQCLHTHCFVTVKDSHQGMAQTHKSLYLALQTQIELFSYKKKRI